mgnify:FL=1
MTHQHTTELVTEIVKALGILLNTGSVYDVEHPVFDRTLDERFGVFEDGLRETGNIKLEFREGQVVYKNIHLEPGADMFEKISRRLQAKGLTGLIIKTRLKKEDIKKFVHLLKQMKDSKSSIEINDLIQREKIRGLSAFTAAENTHSRAVSTTETPGVQHDRQAERKMFELDDNPGIEAMQLEDVFDTAQSADEATGMNEVKQNFEVYVDDVLDKMQADQISHADACASITDEFETQLNLQIEDYKSKTETRIRRLENIKDLVLDELESLELAAIVVDQQLNVIALNKSGRRLLGRINRLERGTPLAQFVAASREKQKLKIKGEERTAHLVISEASQGNDGAMLICLD